MKFKTFFKATALCLPFCSATFAAAENPVDSLPMQKLDEVNVLGAYAQIASEQMRVVRVVDREQIATMPVQNINELLDYLPGVDVRQRGANGVQADVSMRGGTFDQVLILLNGVNVTDPQTGHYSLDMPVDLAMVSRIEVLQGAAVSLFGLSSFSGAINIITDDAERKQVTAAVTGGDFGLFSPSVGASYHVGKWHFGASGGYNQSSGYRDNTDYKIGNAFAQLGFSDAKVGKFLLQGGYQKKDFGANSFYSLAYPAQFEATQTQFGSLSWKKGGERFAFEASAYYRRHSDRFELYRGMEGAAAWYTGHNYHVTQVSGVNGVGKYFSKIGQSSVGFELRNENILSNVLGDALDNPLPVGGADNTFYTKQKNRLNINYFAEQSFIYERFIASVGVAGNYNTMFKNNFSFGANAGYRFAKNGTVFVNVNRALRLPTFTDLYYQSATQESNPNLLPEKALTTELGARWSNNHWNASATAYYRVGQQIIDWVKAPDDVKWRAMNHTRVDASGFELMAGFRNNYWLRRAELSYAFTHLNQTSGDLMSKYALDYLRNKLALNVEHRIYRGFGANWQLVYQERHGSYTDAAGAVQDYRPVWLFDGRIYWQNEQVNVFIEGSNLLNRLYYDYGGIAQPQRWLKAGIAVKFGLK